MELYVASDMQHTLDTWEGALQVMGGANIPDKRFWSLIGFQWMEGTWWYKDEQDAPATLSVKDGDGNQIQLECLSPDATCWTLGVCLALDGNNKEEIAKKWNANIQARHLQCHEAWYVNFGACPPGPYSFCQGLLIYHGPNPVKGTSCLWYLS